MEVTYEEAVWKNGCEHPVDGYLGTVWKMEATGRAAYDVYIFPERGRYSLCFRYGNEDHEYISPGSLDECFARVAERRARGEEHPYTPMLDLVQDVMARKIMDSCLARWKTTGDVLFGELAAFIGTFRRLAKR